MSISPICNSYLSHKNLYTSNYSAPVQFNGKNNGNSNKNKAKKIALYGSLFLTVGAGCTAVLSYRNANRILKGAEMNFLPKMKIGFRDLMNKVTKANTTFELTGNNTLKENNLLSENKLSSFFEYSLPEGKGIRAVVYNETGDFPVMDMHYDPNSKELRAKKIVSYDEKTGKVTSILENHKAEKGWSILTTYNVKNGNLMSKEFLTSDRKIFTCYNPKTKQLIGRSKTYPDSNQNEKAIIYVDGKLNKITEYYPTGNERKTTWYDKIANLKTINYYDPKGKLKACTKYPLHSDTVIHKTTFNSKGKVITSFEQDPLNGTIKELTYYPNSKLRSKTEISIDKKTIKETIYTKTGKVKSEQVQKIDQQQIEKFANKQ